MSVAESTPSDAHDEIVANSQLIGFSDGLGTSRKALAQGGEDLRLRIADESLRSALVNHLAARSGRGSRRPDMRLKARDACFQMHRGSLSHTAE